MKALRHAAEHLAQSDRLARRKPEGPGHAFGVEFEELADCGSRAEHAARARDVPADIVMRRKHRIADPAFDFDAENQRVDEVRSRDRAAFGIGKQSACDWTGGVNDGTQMRVVEVKDMRAYAVDQCRMEHIKPFAA